MATTNETAQDAAESPFAELFERLVGAPPFPYQSALAERSPWPDLLDVPTGLGKTAAVVVAWLWKRLNGEPDTGRRLVYCLPMRVLVEQTRDAARVWCQRAAPIFAAAGKETPTVHVLMGGDVDASWDTGPETPAILIGTQDMLLSRALGRGYGMSRYRWPVHFGLLNDDCFWVLDETQLMGVGVETSAQLLAFRKRFGTFGPAGTLWMSATLGRGQLATVDHPEPAGGWDVQGISDMDRGREVVRQRIRARKQLILDGDLALTSDSKRGYARALATHVAEAAGSGLTLVVVNRVDRAREIYSALRRLRPEQRLALIHGRFRPGDRRGHEAVLHEEGDRIVVATQAVEAGVDVSARRLYTELAPWPSLVQRFGRCNRYGDVADAEVHVLPIASDAADLALPYPQADLVEAASLLERLLPAGDVGPEVLRAVPFEPPAVLRPVIRRGEILELFDTTPDLHGNDLDVSRYVRDGEDLDIQAYWRPFELERGRPPGESPGPTRDELCRVSLKSARDFLAALDKARVKLERGGQAQREAARRLRAWQWDALAKRWQAVRRPVPGDVWLLPVEAEGYDPEQGWTGEVTGSAPVPIVGGGGSVLAAMDADEETELGRWIPLDQHLADVATAAKRLTAALDLDGWSSTVVDAARWHDVGKAHAEFQRRLVEPVADDPALKAPGSGPWAKSSHHLRPRGGGYRRHFRHELASAMAWLQAAPAEDSRRHALGAYLVAAHHGKIRLTIRSLPDEKRPADPETLFARGVWQGDLLPAVPLPNGTATPADLALDLGPMRLGEGSWLERMLALRDDPELGPFRLALLEALLRAADAQASAAEASARKERSDG